MELHGRSYLSNLYSYITESEARFEDLQVSFLMFILFGLGGMRLFPGVYSIPL